MMRTGWGWLFLIALVGLLAQDPTDTPRHDKYREDPNAHCLKGPPEADDPSGHQCACKKVCSEPDAEGQSSRLEQTECELYCSIRLCKCFPDNPCAPIVDLKG